MFLQKSDMGSAIYTYQIDHISDGDDSLIAFAIAAAIEEVKGYIMQSAYDTAIFDKIGNERHPLILQLTKDIAKYHFIKLANVDIVYEQARQTYDRAIDFLRGLAKGELRADLPEKSFSDDTTTDDTSLRYHSRKKFNHE